MKKVILGIVFASTCLQVSASQQDWTGIAAFVATTAVYNAKNIYGLLGKNNASVHVEESSTSSEILNNVVNTVTEIVTPTDNNINNVSIENNDATYGSLYVESSEQENLEPSEKLSALLHRVHDQNLYLNQKINELKNQNLHARVSVIEELIQQDANVYTSVNADSLESLVSQSGVNVFANNQNEEGFSVNNEEVRYVTVCKIAPMSSTRIHEELNNETGEIKTTVTENLPLDIAIDDQDNNSVIVKELSRQATPKVKTPSRGNSPINNVIDVVISNEDKQDQEVAVINNDAVNDDVVEIGKNSPVVKELSRQATPKVKTLSRGYSPINNVVDNNQDEEVTDINNKVLPDYENEL